MLAPLMRTIHCQVTKWSCSVLDLRMILLSTAHTSAVSPQKMPKNEKAVRKVKKSLGLKVPNVPMMKNARKHAKNERGGDNPDKNPTIKPQIKGRAISYK